MDQRQEMMDDAIDDVTGLEDEEEGEEVVNQVLDEIGVDLGQSVSVHSSWESITHLANEGYSSARHHKVCRARRSRRARSRKLLVVVAAALVMLAMMTSRHVSTVYEDETRFTRHERAFCIPISRSTHIRLFSQSSVGDAWT